MLIVAIIGTLVTPEPGIFPALILTCWICGEIRVHRHRTEIAANMPIVSEGGGWRPRPLPNIVARLADLDSEFPQETPD
ncbi:MAG: hypothetical protein Q8L13_05805, partial [Bradyrhizobium sp.]|uniref:hypothetical protein n=1 Tax=Bradyrhizobium sp. TaxID=376 RepID=UPI00272EEFD5